MRRVDCSDQVKVTLESMDEMAVQEACRILKDELGGYGSASLAV